MSLSCQQKQQNLIDQFSHCADDQQRYGLIIDLGRALPPMPAELLIEKNLVSGCQSRTYLFSRTVNNYLYYEAQSDALISAGLAALLLTVYNGEKAETLLTCPPDFLRALNLTGYLTPSRSNGLYSVHMRMKRDAIAHLSAQIDQPKD